MGTHLATFWLVCGALHIASLTRLRWLGSRDEFIQMAEQRGRSLDKQHHALLMQMLVKDPLGAYVAEFEDVAATVVPPQSQ